MSRGGQFEDRAPDVPEWERFPLGITGLDRNINGGAPVGSLVLAAGEAGAGAREFLYTSALMNGLADTAPDLFDLYYGDLADAATVPAEIHYVSFTAGAENIREEMLYIMEPEIVESGIDVVEFADLSAQYFRLSPVPREWYADEPATITEMGAGENRQDVIEALADYLDANAADSLVYIDSLTELVDHDSDGFGWPDVVALLQGLRRAIKSWNGVVVVHVSREALPETRLGSLMAAVDGTMLFEWASGGNERDRTMVIREFRGVLSELEAEDIVRFETDVTDAGFDISNIRKIR